MGLKGTTILGLKGDKCAIAGDGQVTARRKRHHEKRSDQGAPDLWRQRVVIGLPEAFADAFALSEKFEAKAGRLRRKPAASCR